MWQDYYVEELFERQKWFNEGEEVAVGDLVMFKKESSDFSSHFSLGKVDEVCDSHDDRLRNVWIRYKNNNEANSRRVERDIKSIYKILGIKETSLHESLEQAWKIIKEVKFGSLPVGHDAQKVDGEDTRDKIINPDSVPTATESVPPAPDSTKDDSTAKAKKTRAPRGKGKSEVEKLIDWSVKLLDWSVKLAEMRRSTEPEEFYGLSAKMTDAQIDDSWMQEYFDQADAKRLGLKLTEEKVIFID